MTASLVLLAGILVATGLTFVIAGLARPAPRLDAALGQLTGDLADRPPVLVDLGPTASRSERLGAALYRRLPFPLSERQRSALRLQGKSIAEFYADKAVMAIVGAVLPGLVAFVLGLPLLVPLIAVLAGAVAGFCVPDLLLHRATAATRDSGTEALLTYIELVTLERLANASASQALSNAAALSEVPLFIQIRTALERAQLEQQSPYAELRRLAEQLTMPELADLADVMQLDESGAALSGALRARVRELRDAYLSRQQTKAATEAEGMTIYMTIPALIFGLIFLVAAMLRIALA